MSLSLAVIQFDPKNVAPSGDEKVIIKSTCVSMNVDFAHASTVSCALVAKVIWMCSQKYCALYLKRTR